jgi:dTMP kinase
VLATGGFDYWESGMDLPMGEDLYESFVNYQRRIIEELDTLAREYRFETLDATLSVDEVAEDLETRVSRLLETRAHALDGRTVP